MSDPSLVFEHARREREVIERLLRTSDLSPFERLRAFTVFVPRIDLARFIVLADVFRQVLPVPGHIVDCGVYHGFSLFAWAKLADMMCPGQRRVVGFDSFDGFAGLSPEDGAANEQLAKVPGGYRPAAWIRSDLELAAAAMQHDMRGGATPVEVVIGDLGATASAWTAAHPDARVALLHLDVDLYAPTLAALKAFVPRMPNGAVIVLDEYGAEHWQGEKRAVDEYFQALLGRVPPVVRCRWHSQPAGWITVDWAQP